jgi:hypothetical protein
MHAHTKNKHMRKRVCEDFRDQIYIYLALHFFIQSSHYKVYMNKSSVQARQYRCTRIFNNSLHTCHIYIYKKTLKVHEKMIKNKKKYSCYIDRI